MKRAFRSVYADIYVKDAHRIRGTPRVARPWRPKVIAWAGPAAFYRNRFYEPNAWYKARITKPVLYPKMHVIDVDNHLLSLKERLAVPETERYDIGFKKSVLPISLQPSESKNVPKLSRKMHLTINLKKVEHWQLSIFHHYRIFDDIFHTNVFFHNTQNMQLKWGSTGLYQGNLIDAADTSNKPDIWIQSLNGGFSSFVLLNLDGNPYSCGGEIVHCPALIDRIFNVGQLYKEFEKQWTPSSLSFAQASWDASVNEALHRIGMKSPIYEYQYYPPVKMDQKEFPLKPQPFNLYLDQFRNPKEIHADLLKKRLQMRKADKSPEQPKYPDIDYVEHKRYMPFWQHDNLIKENSGFSRYRVLWSNPIS